MQGLGSLVDGLTWHGMNEGIWERVHARLRRVLHAVFRMLAKTLHTQVHHFSHGQPDLEDVILR